MKGKSNKTGRRLNRRTKTTGTENKIGQKCKKVRCRERGKEKGRKRGKENRGEGGN